jgi:hypothetical protein
VFVHFTEGFNKFRDKIIFENHENSKLKPKFLRKEKKPCPNCLKEGKTNRFKWTIRKMPKKHGETQQWKCTCQICGELWFTDSGDEYWYSSEISKSYLPLGF